MGKKGVNADMQIKTYGFTVPRVLSSGELYVNTCRAPGCDYSGHLAYVLTHNYN